MARSRVTTLALAVVLTAIWSGPAATASGDRTGSVTASGRFVEGAGAASQHSSSLGPCEVTLTEVRLHAITYAGLVLGLDYVTYHGAPELSFTSILDGKVFFADPDSGAELGSFDLNPANNGAFGVHEWNGMMFNDWNTWDRYHTDTDGIGWATYANPAQD